MFMSYNGSAIVAMGGKECVGIASDKRLGIERFSTITSNFRKVFRLSDKTFVGFAGLATDVQTVYNHLRYRMNLYKLREDRQMKPHVVSNLLSTMLYSRRFAPWFVSPVVAGLDEDNEPFLSTFDFIGAPSESTNFVAAGTAYNSLITACETFWKEDMNPDELFEILSQCLMASLDRCPVAGWGGTVYILTPDTLTTKELATRMD